MTTFVFSGRSVSGTAVSGKIEANSADSAASQLIERGVTPVNIAEDREKSNKSIDFQKFLAKPPSLQDLMFFSRQMYSLTKAGVPLVKALNSLLETTQNPLMVQALIDIVAGLDSGKELSAAMKEHPKVFNSLFISMISVGENTGQLEESFRMVSQNIEREMATRARIKSATRYPMFVMIAIVIAMFIVNLMVIPKFANVFKSFHAELPIFTKILVFTSNITVDYWPAMIFLIVVAGVSIKVVLKTPVGRFRWDTYKLKLPIFGSIIHRALLTRFAYTLAMTTKAGVPISQALNICATSESNTYVTELIREMRSRVERGEPLTRTASASGLFTPVVIQMLSVGEDSGMVDAMLQEVGEYYEREVDFDLARLSASLEPVLLTVIGIMVLVMALGIFLPMWDLGKAAMG
ncbi:MAG: type II secretion system F family protein [Gammaproteobacteria bacterium]